MSMEKAQRMYDNQTPWDGIEELPDKVLDEYMETSEWCDYVEENRGGEDWVSFSEKNFDVMYEFAVEWYNKERGE